MKKIIFVMMVALLLNLSLVNAVTQQELNEAKGLIDSKPDCKSLSDSQLEIIGEYYMEQMHPGEAHELMHRMMGLQEGSDPEKQFHINMARTLYCGESGGMMGSGMMGMMNMMGGGMMGGGFGYFGFYNFFGFILWLLAVIALVLLIVWLIKQLGQKRRK